MGARDLSDALICAVLAASGAFAAQTPPTRGELEAHARGVFSERVGRFVGDFAARPAAVQELADVALQKHKAAGAGAAWMPTHEALYFAWRQLLDEEGEGGEPAGVTELQRLSAALDLRVVPGVFEARTQGLGEALTVFVRPLYPFVPSSDFYLSLEWANPSVGQTRARREPIGVDALRDGGFEMYVRSPLGAPAAWQMLGIAARDEAGAITGLLPPVAVEGIAELPARLQRALATREGEPAGRAHLRRALELLRNFGLRTTPSLRASALLEAVESWSGDEPVPDVPVPLELLCSDASGGEHWIWGLQAGVDARRTLLVLAPATESVDTVLAGSLGEDWIALARRHGATLLASHLPADLRALGTVFERARKLGAGELIVVARGETFARLQAGLFAATEPPFDALVMSCVIASIPPQELFAGVERLLVAPGASAAPAGDEQLTWIEGSWTPLLNEPRLPALVDAWLARRDAARKPDDR